MTYQFCSVCGVLLGVQEHLGCGGIPTFCTDCGRAIHEGLCPAETAAEFRKRLQETGRI